MQHYGITILIIAICAEMIQSQGVIVGGITQLDLKKNHKLAESLAVFSIKQYNAGLKLSGKDAYRLKEIVSLASQVVAGIKYYLNVRITAGKSTKACEFQIVKPPFQNAPLKLTSSQCK